MVERKSQKPISYRKCEVQQSLYTSICGSCVKVSSYSLVLRHGITAPAVQTIIKPPTILPPIFTHVKTAAVPPECMNITNSNKDTKKREAAHEILKRGCPSKQLNFLFFALSVLYQMLIDITQQQLHVVCPRVFLPPN